MQQWIEASRQGDVAAFNRLVLIWEGRIFNLCSRLLQNESDAEETTQEVFVRAFGAIRRFRHEASFSSWLYRIATNQCMTRLRRRRREPECSLDDESIFASIASRSASRKTHEQQLIDRDTDRHVKEALGCLSPEQRVVVELKFFQDLTFEQIATVIGVPLSTVKSRLYDGLGVLKKRLSHLRRAV